MSHLPTRGEFRQMINPEHGIWDPEGAIVESRNRTHAISILAGAYINSFHHRISRLLAANSYVGTDPLKRTMETLDLLDRIEFGDPDTALKGADDLWSIHANVNATMEDGSPVSAIEPSLLSVAFIVGFRSTASLQVLMHSVRNNSEIQRARDELFAKYWKERAALGAALGIPYNYLPSDPVEAWQWLIHEIKSNTVLDAERKTVEGFVENYAKVSAQQAFGRASTISQFFADHVSASITTEMMKAVAYYAATDEIAATIYPNGHGVPLQVRAELVALPTVNNLLPDGFFGGIPRACPHAAHVKAKAQCPMSKRNG